MSALLLHTILCKVQMLHAMQLAMHAVLCTHYIYLSSNEKYIIAAMKLLWTMLWKSACKSSNHCHHQLWPGLRKYGMWALKIWLLFKVLALITFYSIIVQPQKFQGLLIIYFALQHCLENPNTTFQSQFMSQNYLPVSFNVRLIY